MNTTESPKQEAAERLAEMGPLLAFPRMMEVIHHNKSRKAYRDRVNDAHKAGTAALRGEGIPEPVESEPDEMGDSFSIQGDTVNKHYYLPQSDAPNAPSPKKPMSTLAKAALTAALLGSGAGLGVGVPWLAGMFDKSQPPAVEQPEYESGIEVTVQ